MTFGWNDTDVIGSEIEMDIKNGELVTIQGQVGAGKSSLLNLLLGEVKIHSGTMSINGSISYCSQEPWIFLGTIRENILFGKTFDSEKYNKGTVSIKKSADHHRTPQPVHYLLNERNR